MVQQEALVRRRQRLEQLLAERRDVLVGFAEALKFEAPELIVEQPGAFTDGISSFMRDQDLSDEQDLIWAMARLAYFIGEVIIESHGGTWFVNESEGSKLYLKIVIGRFDRMADPSIQVDPFHIARLFLQSPPPRDLAEMLDQLFQMIETAN
jgi:hypothetical protein